jgi:mRNA interferase MazF
MQRGEIWWANIESPIGRRPVVLISRNSVYQNRDSVTIVPITRTIRRIPVEVELDEQDGLLYPYVINVDGIATIRKLSLDERITSLSEEKMEQVNKAIIFALDLD